MADYTKSVLKEIAKDVGVNVWTWSPGDGTTRYRFAYDGHDYFSCNPIFTALGLKEAGVFMRGYIAGRGTE